MKPKIFPVLKTLHNDDHWYSNSHHSNNILPSWLVTYTDECGNKINNNDERTHFFRKIYLSYFIRKGCERVMCEKWVGDWTNCNILTPSSSVFSGTSFSFPWAAQPGVLKMEMEMFWQNKLVLSTASYLQLTDPNSLNFLSHRVI